MIQHDCFKSRNLPSVARDKGATNQNFFFFIFFSNFQFSFSLRNLNCVLKALTSWNLDICEMHINMMLKHICFIFFLFNKILHFFSFGVHVLMCFNEIHYCSMSNSLQTMNYLNHINIHLKIYCPDAFCLALPIKNKMTSLLVNRLEETFDIYRSQFCVNTQLSNTMARSVGPKLREERHEFGQPEHCRVRIFRMDWSNTVPNTGHFAWIGPTLSPNTRHFAWIGPQIWILWDVKSNKPNPIYS